MAEEKIAEGGDEAPDKHTGKGWFLRGVKCLVMAVVVVALLFGGILYFNIYLPQGKGPAGPHVPAEPFSHIWSEQPILLLGIGDSITDGFGARDGFSYFQRLIKNPEGDSPDISGKNLSAVFPNIEALNISVSGSNSLRHLKDIEQFPPQPADLIGIVVMTSVGNDLILNYGRRPAEEGAMYGAIMEQAKGWIENYRQRMDLMVRMIKDKFPGGCEIFLANIYDPSDGTGDTKEFFTGLPAWPDGLAMLAEYNKIISDCAARYDYVHLIDIHTPFMGHGIHCRRFWIKHYRWSDPTYWYYMNIEDPSERGYDCVRRVFLLKMIEVFNKTEKPNG